MKQQLIVLAAVLPFAFPAYAGQGLSLDGLLSKQKTGRQKIEVKKDDALPVFTDMRELKEMFAPTGRSVSGVTGKIAEAVLKKDVPFGREGNVFYLEKFTALLPESYLPSAAEAEARAARRLREYMDSKQEFRLQVVVTAPVALLDVTLPYGSRAFGVLKNASNTREVSSAVKNPAKEIKNALMNRAVTALEKEIIADILSYVYNEADIVVMELFFSRGKDGTLIIRLNQLHRLITEQEKELGKSYLKENIDFIHNLPLNGVF